MSTPKGWQCFLATEASFAQHYLRRYSGMRDNDNAVIKECPIPKNHGYHNAVVYLEQVPKSPDEKMITGCTKTPGETRWPLRCACGYVFEPDDEYQDGFERLWQGQGTGAHYGLFIMRNAPIGAIWCEEWRKEFYSKDAVNFAEPLFPLMVQTPAGYPWFIDGKASNGPGWKRTGQPPMITATPSIAQAAYKGCEGYHGFLTAGILSPDLEGRTYAEPYTAMQP